MTAPSSRFLGLLLAAMVSLTGCISAAVTKQQDTTAPPAAPVLVTETVERTYLGQTSLSVCGAPLCPNIRPGTNNPFGMLLQGGASNANISVRLTWTPVAPNFQQMQIYVHATEQLSATSYGGKGETLFQKTSTSPFTWTENNVPWPDGATHLVIYARTTSLPGGVIAHAPQQSFEGWANATYTRSIDAPPT